MAGVGEFIVLVLVGLGMLAVGVYGTPIGLGFQVLITAIGIIFLFAGIVAILRKSASA